MFGPFSMWILIKTGSFCWNRLEWFRKIPQYLTGSQIFLEFSHVGIDWSLERLSYVWEFVKGRIMWLKEVLVQFSSLELENVKGVYLWWNAPQKGNLLQNNFPFHFSFLMFFCCKGVTLTFPIMWILWSVSKIFSLWLCQAPEQC